jgi:hypothetical protein
MARKHAIAIVALLLGAASGCAKSSKSGTSASASASASAPAPTWIADAREIWGGGDEPVPMNLTAMDEGRGPDAGKPTDVVAPTAILTGRLPEQGDALAPALADRVLKTMRIKSPGAPKVVLFRLFRDDIAPDAAMGTIVIADDPAHPIDWATVQPKDLGKLLPELAKPSRAKTSIVLTRSFARAWRTWTTGYAETWDGKPMDAAATTAMCERAVALDMVPGGVIPAPADRGKDCAPPKTTGSSVTWSCFYGWETKKERYTCTLEPGKAPAIEIAAR